MTPAPGRRKVRFHTLPSGKILPCPLLHRRHRSTEGTMTTNRKSTASPLSSPVWRGRRPAAASGNRRHKETWLSGNKPTGLPPLRGTIKNGVPSRGGVPKLQGKLSFLLSKVRIRHGIRGPSGGDLRNTPSAWPISDSFGLFDRSSWGEMSLETGPGVREGHSAGERGPVQASPLRS